MASLVMDAALSYWFRKFLPTATRLRLEEVFGAGLYRGFSDLHRAIFIHIPKTAGVSLKQSLGVREETGHADYRTFQMASPAKCRTYFKFAFVRNPWGRLLSAYSFLDAGGIPKWDLYWRDRLLMGVSSFEQFVLERLETPLVQDALHFRPQYSFLSDDSGAVMMDYIGRFETIDADFAHVCERLGIAVPLRHINRSAHSSYQDVYTPAMRDMVSRVYSRDIELFGYQFNEPTR
ncbi:sulfotransferase family protein [Emcibacter sp. SYSU 3D8]|uniref:sulfotransferase family protein n=1 Tax=Emcibacter sp. SYSU 3D8 TaxID=3133969 RepID=UPI0031FED217